MFVGIEAIRRHVQQLLGLREQRKRGRQRRVPFDHMAENRAHAAMALMAARLCAAVPELKPDSSAAWSLFDVCVGARKPLSHTGQRALAEEINAMFDDFGMRELLGRVVFPLLPRGEAGAESWDVFRPAVADAVRKAQRRRPDADFVVELAEKNALAYATVKSEVDEGELLPYLALGALAKAVSDDPAHPELPDLLQLLDSAARGGGSTEVAIITGFVEGLDARWYDERTRPTRLPDYLASLAARWA